MASPSDAMPGKTVVPTGFLAGLRPAPALPPARQEVEFAAGLCDYDLHTLLAVERSMGEEGITERFKVIRPAGDGLLHNTAWTVAGGGGDE